MTEYIGYAGSFLVAVSLLMSNVYKLRIINLLGAIIFVVYGYIIGASAVLVVNLFISFVDIYYILHLKLKKNLFRFIPMDYNDMVKDFLYFYSEDIKNYFTDFKDKDKTKMKYYLIVRNFVIVGIFAYTPKNNVFDVDVDYIISDWRDLKNGINFFKHISGNENFKGKKFFVKTSNSHHISYLLKIGFKRITDTDFEYII